MKIKQLPNRIGIIKTSEHPLLVAGIKAYMDHTDQHPYDLVDSLEAGETWEDDKFYYVSMVHLLKIPKDDS